jgi:hypothetical protein
LKQDSRTIADLDLHCGISFRDILDAPNNFRHDCSATASTAAEEEC